MKTEQQISQPTCTSSNIYVFPNPDKHGGNSFGCDLIKGTVVKISTCHNQTMQGIYLGICADGAILLDIETPLGFALCEIHENAIQEIMKTVV